MVAVHYWNTAVAEGSELKKLKKRHLQNLNIENYSFIFT